VENRDLAHAPSGICRGRQITGFLRDARSQKHRKCFPRRIIRRFASHPSRCSGPPLWAFAAFARRRHRGPVHDCVRATSAVILLLPVLMAQLKAIGPEVDLAPISDKIKITSGDASPSPTP
jgi:hypothetical protein